MRYLKAADIPVLKPYLTVEPTQQAETLKNFEKQTALLGERPIIGFCPGAEFGPAKRWPHYHYAKLAEMLIEKGYAVELFGSPKDVEQESKFAMRCQQNCNHSV